MKQIFCFIVPEVSDKETFYGVYFERFCHKKNDSQLHTVCILKDFATIKMEAMLLHYLPVAET